ncbi:MAG: Uma2 family endonuclease [Lacipirellulaceae bacterium]
MSLVEQLAPPTRLGPNDNGVLLSPDEFDTVQDWAEGFRYELVNGVLVVLPPPGFGERSPNDELGYLLRRYRDDQPESSAFNGTAPEQEVAIGANRRRADRAIWVGYGPSFDPDRDTPTVVVEFVSNTSRDRRRDFIDKRREYASAGVKEYWVIDRFPREMTVFRGDSTSLVVGEDETYGTDLLPGFALLLARLLAKAGGSRP